LNIFEFKAIILKNDTMNAAFIEFPFDAFSCFGKNGQIKIYIEINGFKYRSSLVKMGY
jgi:hypothetical protein